MADVDLLVRPRDAARMTVLLQSLGFYESRTAMREREFSPVDHRIPDELGEHSENNVKIELHERIGETLPMDETDITEIVFPSATAARTERLSIHGIPDDSPAAACGRCDGVSVLASHAPSRSRTAFTAYDGRGLERSARSQSRRSGPLVGVFHRCR